MTLLLYGIIIGLLAACSAGVGLNGGSGNTSDKTSTADIRGDEADTSTAKDEDDKRTPRNKLTTKQKDEPPEDPFPGEKNDNVEYTEQTIGFNYGDKVKKSGRDDDWNDGVVCLRGKYRVNFDKGTVSSEVKQDVELEYRDGSGAKVEILVETHEGTTKEPKNTSIVVDYGGHKNRSGPLKKQRHTFKAGEFIRVTFNKDDGNAAHVPFKNNVDPVAVRLLKDTCNLTGG